MIDWLEDILAIICLLIIWLGILYGLPIIFA